MSEETRKYLYEHNSQETAKVVEDYPWGFRLRTTIRYWIETKETKNGGQRFASQTINPKTGQWCAPKYSVYGSVMVMLLNEQGHVHYCVCRLYDNEATVNKFKALHSEHFTEYQKKAIKEIEDCNEFLKKATWKVESSYVIA